MPGQSTISVHQWHCMQVGFSGYICTVCTCTSLGSARAFRKVDWTAATSVGVTSGKFEKNASRKLLPAFLLDETGDPPQRNHKIGFQIQLQSLRSHDCCNELFRHKTYAGPKFGASVIPDYRGPTLAFTSLARPTALSEHLTSPLFPHFPFQSWPIQPSRI